MSFDVSQFLGYQIANAELREYPFPHFYLQPAFPPEAYAALQAILPPTELLRPITKSTVGYTDPETGEPIAPPTKGSEQHRYIGDLGDIASRDADAGRSRYWRDTAEWILSDAFRDLVIAKFAEGVRARLGPYLRIATRVEARFVRDFTSYAIHPHTDSPHKLISLLFYLPRDDSKRHLGTTIFRPIDPGKRCEGSSRHPFSEFKKVVTMEYRPNALFAFLKTDTSFHGVEPIQERGIERNLLLYNIYLRKVVMPAQPAQTGTA